MIARAGGRSPLTYKQFQTVLLSLPPPPAPLHALSRDVIGDSVTPVGDDHDDRYGVPTLEELGTMAGSREEGDGVGENAGWLGKARRALVTPCSEGWFRVVLRRLYARTARTQRSRPLLASLARAHQSYMNCSTDGAGTRCD